MRCNRSLKWGSLRRLAISVRLGERPCAAPVLVTAREPRERVRVIVQAFIDHRDVIRQHVGDEKFFSLARSCDRSCING